MRIESVCSSIRRKSYRGLVGRYLVWLDGFKPASPSHIAQAHFATTVSDYVTVLLVLVVSAVIYALI